MKSNWTTAKVLEKFQKSKVTLLALTVGLALGFAGGQVVHSSNQPVQVQKTVTVTAKPQSQSHHHESQCDRWSYRTSLGLPLLFDPWLKTVSHDQLLGDDWLMGDFVDVPVGWSSFRSATFAPRLEANETVDSVTVTAEVPGIEEKDLEVSVDDSTVTLKGEKKKEITDQERKQGRTERFFGMFERSIRLPCRVESSKAHASLKNGLLTIVIPKSQLAQSERKKLAIQTLN